jgi:hypothetical protein
MAWIFNPNDYEEKDFAPVPEGEHRVRIADVVFKTFKSGNEGYEITLDVSGHSSKLWHYLVIKEDDPKSNTRNFGDFFNSFGITDYDLKHFRSWIGKVGAVRVKHEDYNGTTSAKVSYCILRSKQDKLPEAKFSGSVAVAGGFAPIDIDDSELPFN